MINLNNFIQEKLKLNKDIEINKYTCQPKDSTELHKILKERLGKDKNADLNDIDVSQIKELGLCFSGGLFESLDPHNIDISRWDVSNAISLSQMFYDCSNLNCDLSDWDVSNVENMNYMFRGCKKFEGNGLNNWNIRSLKSMDFMFDNCESLKNKPSWYKE